VLLTSCTPTPAYSNRARLLGAADLVTKPVPLERLLEIVAAHVGEAKRPPRPAAPDPARAPKRSTISGTLDRIPFPAVLHHLHGLRATGVLHLECEKKRKWIQLRDGYPVAVRSNIVRETLGCFLERSGRITPDVLEESRRQMQRESRRQGEVLVAMQVLSEEQVAEALREQADEKLFEIFGWEAGRFHFEQGVKLDRANVLGLGRSPANLILEGVRSRFSIERVDRYLRAQAKRLVAHGRSPFYRFQELHVEPAEDALLRGLDGTQTLGAFLEEEESIRRTVYALLASGLLELQGGPPERQSPARVEQRPPQVASSRPRGDERKPQAAPPRPAGKPRPPAQAPAARPAAAPRGPKAVPPKPREEARRPQTPARAPRNHASAESHAELAALADKLHAGSFFEVLGVPENAGPDAIRSAYESLSAQVHPDRFSGESRSLKELAERVFQRVTEAYEALSDPRRRQEHLLDRKRVEREASKHEQAERALEAETSFRDGEAALRVRDYEGALRCFGRALQLYPDEGDHHAHYGWALYLCHPNDPGMVGEALEHVRRGLKLASHREKPYLFMGRLYRAMGRADVAERMFTRAVQIQPECVEALRELRLIAMRRQKSKGLIGRLLRR
jgi:tetratricopeptide (TPR) repeat protein